MTFTLSITSIFASHMLQCLVPPFVYNVSLSLKLDYKHLMERTTAPGDSLTRRGFFDSVLLGCIPVLFERGVYLPFGSPIIDLEEFAIILSEEDALAPPTTSGESVVVQKLRQLSEHDIQWRQAALSNLATRLQYSIPTKSSVEDIPRQLAGDAFGTILSQLAAMRG